MPRLGSTLVWFITAAEVENCALASGMVQLCVELKDLLSVCHPRDFTSAEGAVQDA